MGDPAGPARQARPVLGLTLCLWLWPGLAGAPPAAAAAGPVCSEPESWRRTTLNTSFERERRLAGMTIPLRSSGRVQSDGTAIWWRTEAPVEMVLRIEAGGVSQSVAGGVMQPLAGSGSGGAEIASLITTLLRGDLASAAAAFTIDRRQDPATGQWHVRLQPKAAQLARLIDTIEISGCKEVEVVLIRQPNGDQDRVVFDAPG